MDRQYLGQVLTFKASVSRELAGIPATVIAVWPRFRSGDYLVTLEFARAVKYGNELITRIDAFASELERVNQKADACEVLIQRKPPPSRAADRLRHGSR